MRNIKGRIEALETMTPEPVSLAADKYHDIAAYLAPFGLSVPEPEPGMTFAAWLKHWPDAALEALLDAFSASHSDRPTPR